MYTGCFKQKVSIAILIPVKVKDFESERYAVVEAARFCAAKKNQIMPLGNGWLIKWINRKIFAQAMPYRKRGLRPRRGP